MRDDYTRAASSLRLLGEAVQACPAEHRPRRSAYIIKLARLVQSNPLIRAAVLEIERQERSDEDALAARMKELSERALALFKRLQDAFARLSDGAICIINNFPSDIRTSAPYSIGDVKKAINEGRAVEFLPADVLMFNANYAVRVRGGLKPFADPQLADVFDVFDEFESLGKDASPLQEVDELMKLASVGRLATRFRDYAARWDERLTGRHPSGQLLSDGIEHDIPFFVETVVAKLEEGVVRLFALHRLRVLFEQFDCAVLRPKLQAAEASEKEREEILQDAMDRFLFHDGYFPVTHSSASRGFFDTLVLENAEISGVPPLLVELKQVTAFANPRKASRKAVTDAISEARGEVERYHGHVATRPQWAGTMPVIVVVHTCAEDLSDLEAADVVLIDLSTATPSKKRKRSADVAD